MNEKFPACWFYWKDWLDFKVMRMSDAAQGVYMRLLAHIWTGTPTQYNICDNENALARALGLPLPTWRRYREEIQWDGDPLLVEEGGFLISKRLRKEVEKLLARRASGEKGGKARRASGEKDSGAKVEDDAKIFVPSAPVLNLTDKLLQNIRGGVTRKLPFLTNKAKTDRWRDKTARAIDALMRIDEVSFDDANAVLDFIRADKPRGTWNGWQAVILSGDNLRDKWSKIVAQMAGARGNEAEWPKDF